MNLENNMAANKIVELNTTMDCLKTCISCWHMVKYLGHQDIGWCGCTTSEYEDLDVNKNTKACKCWNFRPDFKFW